MCNVFDHEASEKIDSKVMLFFEKKLSFRKKSQINQGRNIYVYIDTMLISNKKLFYRL